MEIRRAVASRGGACLERGRKRFLGDASVLWLVWGGVYNLGVCIIVKRIERNTLDLCILTPIIYTQLKRHTNKGVLAGFCREVL